MAESIIRISKVYEDERMYCKNIESIINMAESIFVRFGALYAILILEFGQQD